VGDVVQLHPAEPSEPSVLSVSVKTHRPVLGRELASVVWVQTPQGTIVCRCRLPVDIEVSQVRSDLQRLLVSLGEG